MPDAPLPTAPTGLGRRVLVVDDYPDSRRSLARIVRLWGHEPREAADGHAALQAAKEFLPDAIVLDLGLPGLDGHEVVRRLRREVLSRALVVAVSGWSRPDDVRKALEAGCDHHLTKPCDPDELRALLEGRRPIPVAPVG
jgi:CheY-like chemotaxis protein